MEAGLPASWKPVELESVILMHMKAWGGGQKCTECTLPLPRILSFSAHQNPLVKNVLNTDCWSPIPYSGSVHTVGWGGVEYFRVRGFFCHCFGDFGHSLHLSSGDFGGVVPQSLTADNGNVFLQLFIHL